MRINVISPHLVSACLKDMFIAYIITIATKNPKSRKEGFDFKNYSCSVYSINILSLEQHYNMFYNVQTLVFNE